MDYQYLIYYVISNTTGFKILDEGDRELPLDNALVSKLKVSNTEQLLSLWKWSGRGEG